MSRNRTWIALLLALAFSPLIAAGQVLDNDPDCTPTTCDPYSTTVNCTPGNVTLTNAVVTPTNGCPATTQFGASVTVTTVSGLATITTICRDNCDNVCTNGCPGLQTNAVSPNIISNGWTVVVGAWSTNGPGTGVSFTPTNCGAGTVTFVCYWTDGCSPDMRTTTQIANFNVVGVQDASASEGALISSGPNSKTYVVCKGTNDVIVTATPCPNVSEQDVPDCWTTSGGNGTAKLTRTVSKTTSGSTTVTFTAGTSSISVSVIVVEVNFDVTEWNPVVQDPANHYVQIIQSPPGHYATVLPRLATGDTFELNANVSVSADPDCECQPGDDCCREWTARIFQNVVAHTHTVRWTTNYTVYSINPIPGYDEGEETEDESSFAHCGDEVALSVADTPADSLRPLWWPLAGKPNNPLTRITRDTTFVTWLAAEHNTNGEIEYLKWVKWRVTYDVGYTVTSTSVTTALNTWTFEIIGEGDGMGPHTPTFTVFTETGTDYSIP
jgi:hypothetical protein